MTSCVGVKKRAFWYWGSLVSRVQSRGEAGRQLLRSCPSRGSRISLLLIWRYRHAPEKHEDNDENKNHDGSCPCRDSKFNICWSWVVGRELIQQIAISEKTAFNTGISSEGQKCAGCVDCGGHDGDDGQKQRYVGCDGEAGDRTPQEVVRGCMRGDVSSLQGNGVKSEWRSLRTRKVERNHDDYAGAVRCAALWWKFCVRRSSIWIILQKMQNGSISNFRVGEVHRCPHYMELVSGRQSTTRTGKSDWW